MALSLPASMLDNQVPIFVFIPVLIFLVSVQPSLAGLLHALATAACIIICSLLSGKNGTTTTTTTSSSSSDPTDHLLGPTRDLFFADAAAAVPASSSSDPVLSPSLTLPLPPPPLPPLPPPPSSSSYDGDSSLPADCVRLNIGGTVFVTTRRTLVDDCKHENYFKSQLRFQTLQRSASEADDASSLSSAAAGSSVPASRPLTLFVDRDPAYFRHVLNFIRDETLPPPLCSSSQISSTDVLLSPQSIHVLHEVLSESRFYSLEFLSASISSFLERTHKEHMETLTPHKEWKIVNNVQNAELETVFRSYLDRGWDFDTIAFPNPRAAGGGGGIVPNILSAVGGGAAGGGGGLALPPLPGGGGGGGGAGPGTPTRRVSGNNGAQENYAQEGATLVFSKNLSRSDVSFFDRLMKGS